MLTRVLVCVALGAAPFFTAFAKASADRPATAGPTVELDRMIITTSPDYRFLETGWEVGEVPGLRIFSHGNAAAKRISEHLQLAREAFGLVWKDEALLRQIVTVVVTADDAEFLAWADLPPTAMDRTVRVVSAPGGTVLLVNGANLSAHRTAGRGFVLALLSRTKLPPWLKEGLAQIVNSVEAQGDRLIVGKVQQDVRNHLALETLDQMDIMMLRNPPQGYGTGRFDEQPYLVNSRGNNVEVLVDGMVGTRGDIEQALRDEKIRRIDERYTYAGSTDFISFLDDGVVMDLEKILDPAARDSVAWRMNAWGFTHYSLFGEKKRYYDEFLRFVQALEKSPARAPVDVFKETFQVSPGKYELSLALYVKQASYEIYDFRLAEPFKPAVLALNSVLESNVLQLKARVYAATARAEVARQFMEHGYGNPQNRTPAYVRQYIELERAHDADRAARLLEDADRRELLDNPGRRLLAEARLGRLQRAGAKLSPQDLRMVLTPLFAAFEKGDQTEEMFVLIGKAWAASAVPPRDEHLNALRLGLTIHPQSKQLAELLKQLEHS